MAATVEPASFGLVDFDAGRIVAITEQLAAAIGVDTDVTIRVDETSALGHTELASLDPLVIATESGALEDPKRIRKLSEPHAADVIGRHLLRANDRRRAEFGQPPDDEDLDLGHRVAWEIHTIGRLDRLGFPVNRQRWLYAFRTRHGFTDAADAAFERLWAADALTWDQIAALSDEVAAQNPGKLDRKPA